MSIVVKAAMQIVYVEDHISRVVVIKITNFVSKLI